MAAQDGPQRSDGAQDRVGEQRVGRPVQAMPRLREAQQRGGEDIAPGVHRVLAQPLREDGQLGAEAVGGPVKQKVYLVFMSDVFAALPEAWRARCSIRRV